MGSIPSFAIRKTLGFAALSLIAVMLAVVGVSTAIAEERCLRIALPELHTNEQTAATYRAVMKDAGLCVHTISVPQIRAFDAISKGEADGILAAREDFPAIVGVPVVPGNVVLMTLPAMLIVPEGPITGMDDLTGEVLGLPLGAVWPQKLMARYPDLMTIPQAVETMHSMLLEGRIKTMLIDAYSLANLAGGVPNGYKAIPVDQLLIRSWLRAEFADLVPQFDEGTKSYLSQAGY
ncbi:hypothetical protein UF64_15615 [Thalassospira sp. HJ]|uniref:hypothetical protein n=1 Tax=Thalassospira sp. HJ TaxID=1616823 RepID=UPI0005CE8E71|nr:hypothetical protein [Thalassospira sp. HJ]KJE34484.1 hypothetical protein UF64_15615 [Thalassospira sp. HJ]